MRFKKTIWMAFIFLSLALLLFYVYIPWEIRHEDNEQKQRQLFSFGADDITGMSVQYPDWNIKIKRTSDREWTITEPVKSPANNIVVFNIAEYLPTMDVLQVVDENPSDLSKYGLLSPSMKMFFTLKNGRESIILGDDSARVGSNYALKNNERKVILVPNVLKKALMRGIEGWVKKVE